MADAPIVLFDGVCNVCNASVQFIIDHERDHELTFASLQSEAGAAVLKAHGREPLKEGEAPDTLMLVEGGQLYERSTAVLRMARHLRFPWSLVRVFAVVPRPIRDFFYKLFARNRYRLFGKTDACRIPSPALKARFVG